MHYGLNILNDYFYWTLWWLKFNSLMPDVDLIAMVSATDPVSKSLVFKPHRGPDRRIIIGNYT